MHLHKKERKMQKDMLKILLSSLQHFELDPVRIGKLPNIPVLHTVSDVENDNNCYLLFFSNYLGQKII